MTSKEALEKLMGNRSHETGISISETNTDLYDIISKDLEILEILKRNITLYGGIIDFYRDEDRNVNCKINTDDYEIIREWLEYDPN